MFARILKGNPYHDAKGRFSSKDTAGASGNTLDGGLLGYDAKLSDYYAKHDDPSVTPEKVMGQFSQEVLDEVANVLDRAKRLPSTYDVPEYRTKDKKDWSASRKALHDEIVAEFFTDEKIAMATPTDGEPPKFIILGGRGGSGKSAFTNGTISEFDHKHALILDSDKIKERLRPPYDGWNAASVHEESAELFDIISARARDLKLNVVHDITLKSMNSEREILKFQSEGYDVEGHYMFLPRKESARRGVLRYLGKDGRRSRLVPVKVLLSMTENEKNFDALKPYFSKWSAYDNQGDSPKLLSRGKK